MGEVILTDRPSVTNQQINSIVPRSEFDASFLYYSFKLRKRELLSLGSASGARTPILNKTGFSNLLLVVPPLGVQRRIASILGAYDDLIEVNLRRIAVLEEMARRLFEEWFVNLRHPGSTGVLGGEGGSLPFGWRSASLGDELEALEAGSRPKGGIKNGEGDVPSIGAENVNGLGRYDYGKEKLIPRAFFATMRRGIVRDGDVLLYKDGAHIGRLSMARRGFPHDECAVNEHVFILRPRLPMSPEYLYFWLSQTELQQRIRGLNSNAAQPGLNQPAVNSLPITVPPASLLTRFTENAGAALSLLFELAKANLVLARSRDLLLPRLISGDLQVTAAERELEAVT